MECSRSNCRTALLFMTHQWSNAIGKRFLRLLRESGRKFSVHLLLDRTAPDVVDSWRGFLISANSPVEVHTFSAIDLERSLGYQCREPHRLVPGSTHYPVINFAKRKQYRYYWLVESDVELYGDWSKFFSYYDDSTADCLASHYRAYRDSSSWPWYNSVSVPWGRFLPKRFIQHMLYKAFFPIYRLSHSAVIEIDRAHRKGWRGHYEGLVPTVLAARGLVTQDLVATAAVYTRESTDVGGSEKTSSMRYRPYVSTAEVTSSENSEVLFHPVKDNWWIDGQTIVREEHT